jgi:hypothetical protein
MDNNDKFVTFLESIKNSDNQHLVDAAKDAFIALNEAEGNQLDMLASALAGIIKSNDKGKFDKFIQVVEKHFPDDSIKMFGLLKEKAKRIVSGEGEKKEDKEDKAVEKPNAEEVTPEEPNAE